MVKNLPALAGDTRDTGLIPGSGRPPGGGNGKQLQYSCLVNPMDRGTWQAIIHGITQNQTRVSDSATKQTGRKKRVAGCVINSCTILWLVDDELTELCPQVLTLSVIRLRKVWELCVHGHQVLNFSHG